MIFYLILFFSTLQDIRTSLTGIEPKTFCSGNSLNHRTTSKVRVANDDTIKLQSFLKISNF